MEPWGDLTREWEDEEIGLAKSAISTSCLSSLMRVLVETVEETVEVIVGETADTEGEIVGEVEVIDVSVGKRGDVLLGKTYTDAVGDGDE